ncbi:hypothetical protein [Lactobacillus sp.]|uniref:hypothetical protein n=1 Tax=Lactobacillus sp. TaxID=1591 RepID=UPI0019A60B8E|nr:hypothetical protein [Lactobacillus sp.]MBD5430527.1 hypothetical protein [Lactobacillus sp.]MBD5430819.1 hypothetical protein [Lactobacillus sp.]
MKTNEMLQIFDPEKFFWDKAADTLKLYYSQNVANIPTLRYAFDYDKEKKQFVYYVGLTIENEFFGNLEIILPIIRASTPQKAKADQKYMREDSDLVSTISFAFGVLGAKSLKLVELSGKERIILLKIK